MDYEKQLENDTVCVSYLKLMPHEEIGEHYDVYPHVVIALQGGVVTRLEADGSRVLVEFPTGKAVFRPAETPAKMHRTINASNEEIVLIVVQLTSDPVPL
ncbi:hypothetical protein H0W26_04645 [Candidatus Dependentiae bacterium]|nr:hypothetical protein [Candidatus Dependentiae bacterium]